MTAPKFGRMLEYEPEDREPVSFISFEHIGDDDEMPYEEEGGERRRDWHVRMAVHVLGEVGVMATDGAGDAWREVLKQEVEEQGEIGFWQMVCALATLKGYDVYESDTRVEVYEPEPPLVRDIMQNCIDELFRIGRELPPEWSRVHERIASVTAQLVEVRDRQSLTEEV